MIRKFDNPPPRHDGPIRVYFGPAKNRPLERILTLWHYASARHAHSLSPFWFRLCVGCVNAMTFADENWVRKAATPENQRCGAETMARFRTKYPPLPKEEWPKEE